MRTAPIGKNLPLVSVIIPVWNDATGLVRCLSGLRSQSYPASHLQLIVVDNGSTDGSYELAKSFAEVTLLREEKPGSYAARNAGLRRAQGTYVAFIDSDCVPDKTWIEQGIVAASHEPNLGVLAGQVEITHEDCPRPSAAVLYERMFSFNQKANAEQGACVAANWLSPKAVLDHFGGFDASLKSAGDSKLSRQISQSGHLVRYCDAMIVYHPARATLGALMLKRRRVVGGKFAGNEPGAPKTSGLVAIITWDAVLRSLHALRSRDVRVFQRLQIVGVIAALWAFGVAELARLALGFEPRR